MSGKDRGMKHLDSDQCRHSSNANNQRGNIFFKIFFPIIGFLSLLWMLVRIIPKPSRAQYPCMKVAAPIAGSFVAYISSLAIAVFSFRKAREYFLKSRVMLASLLVFTAIAAGSFAILRTDENSYARTANDSLFVPTDPPNTPVGTAKGIHPGRVVWMRDSTAATWDGKTGYWWDDRYTHQVNVDSMLSRSLRALTGEPNDSSSWTTLFKYFNSLHGKGTVGYESGEKVAVKINLNQIGGPGYTGNSSITCPQSVLALLHQLVYHAGVPDSDITVYDMIRYVPDAIYTKCKTEFPNVHFMGWSATNGREQYIRDTTNIHWSQKLTVEIGGGNPAYLPTAVTHASYLINLASLKGHRYAGVTFCAKNHFGSLSCDDSTGTPYAYAPHAAGVHPYIAVHNIIIPGSAEWTFYGRPMGTYNALVDLMGHRDLGTKTLLFMVEGLYAGQTEGDPISSNSKWLSAPFNNNWTSSIFVSQDNVAIESVCLDFIRAEATINPHDTTIYGAVDNYLHEAAQADNPPSGTFYDPNGDGIRLQSLGVHEHWNNSTDKQYSRNLGTGDGIELVKLNSTVTSVRHENTPKEFILSQNYPNPFNPSTAITYQLALESYVTLRIYDVLGQEVTTLVQEKQSPGTHAVRFDGTNYPSGVYFYNLQVNTGTGSGGGQFNETKKFVLLK